jgi:uncharacterized protein (TIGR03437 family)
MNRFIFLLACSAVAASAQTPVITEILNNYGLVVPGRVARGAIFIVKGSNLSDQTTGLHDFANGPLPTELRGVRMEITVGGVTTVAPLYYVLPQQLAGVLPSSTPLGTGTLIVRNNGRNSAPATINVVASAFGVLTLNGAGTGMAAVHNDAYQLLSNTNATNPGKAVIFYGSGLGAVPHQENNIIQPATNLAQSAGLTVTIGGVTAVVAYAGRSYYPGLDQINVTIPTLPSSAYGCSVPVVITTNGIQANATSIPVAASGSTCPSNDPPPGSGGSGTLTQADIDRIIGQGFLRSGTVSLSRVTVYTLDPLTSALSLTSRTDEGNASFMRISGPDFAAYMRSGFEGNPASPQPTAGTCTVINPATPSNPFPNLTSQDLDAGATLTIQGPAGSRTLQRVVQGGDIEYRATLGNATPGNYLDAGRYTASGAGGPQVGSFSVSVDVAPELVWTNRAQLTSVTRANGLTITWTGGEPTQLVQIYGSSLDPNNQAASRAFQCYANQSAGQFTVPASILNQLPASTTIGVPPFAITLPGSLAVTSVGKVATTGASGMDVIFFTSQSTVTQSVVFR